MPHFPKSARITRSRDFERLRVGAKSVTNRLFKVRWRDGATRRMGVVVAKKVVGLATKRNQIKRVVRECFRLQPSRFPMGDVLLIAGEGLVDLPKKAIRQVLWDVLAKAKK